MSNCNCENCECNRPDDEPMVLRHQENGTDYVLIEDAPSCWVTVDNISVYVRRCEEGVEVSLFPSKHEMLESLESAYLPFQAAQNAIDSYEAMLDAQLEENERAQLEAEARKDNEEDENETDTGG